MASPGIGNLPKRRTARLISGHDLHPIYSVKTVFITKSTRQSLSWLRLVANLNVLDQTDEQIASGGQRLIGRSEEFVVNAIA
jgi:hypothetical protein